MLFKNRESAGNLLSGKLLEYKDKKDVVVLGLPRGGVVVAFEVAKVLNAALDITVPRKIGAPYNEELAIGAITEGGEGIFDERLIKSLDISEGYIHETVLEEKAEAERRLKLYQGSKPKIDLKDKIVIIVDDGVATGYTMRAAIESIKKKKPKEIIIAIPVIAADTLKIIKREADEVIYLSAPSDFGAVGRFYEEFNQTTDEEVIKKMTIGTEIS